MPPPDTNEQDFLKRFTRERPRHIRTRIEYPLLLAAAGVKRFGAKDFANKHCEAQIREEWRRYREGCPDALQISAPLDLLEQAYSWADRLATHFAQTYRSGHIFNFVLGGVAVCLGLSAFMAPHLKFEFAAFELVITFAIILNAQSRLAPTSGTAAGSTIASSPSACGRCAASSCSASPRRTRRALRPIRCRGAGSTGMRAGSGGRWAARRVRSTRRGPSVSGRPSPNSRSRRRSISRAPRAPDRSARPAPRIGRPRSCSSRPSWSRSRP